MPDLVAALNQITENLQTQKQLVQTEEATKNAFIMPFIAALGYNVFNPVEVIPEYNADVVGLKGEKVDYAIMQDGQPAILIECKHTAVNLNDQKYLTQLSRYFNVTDAQLGILTNGEEYWFYSDLKEKNRMDETPFLKVDLSKELDARALDSLDIFTKDTFDVDATRSMAEELIYVNGIKETLLTMLLQPDEEFVRSLYSKSGFGVRFTAQTRSRYVDLAEQAIKEVISDQRIASSSAGSNSAQGASQERENIGEPSEEEMAAFEIVKSIVNSAIDVSRLSLNDQKSYCNVIVDGFTRNHTVCRFYFNDPAKYFMIMGVSDVPGRNRLAALSDINNYADALIERAKMFV